MANGKRNGRAEGIYEVNMTPLIDVSLVLVVILMVATPLAFQSSIALKTAATSGRAAAASARTERVEVTVRNDGRVQVNRQVVPRDQLAAELQLALGASATRLWALRCAVGTSHGEFVSVIDEARSLGACHIAVVGR